MVYYSRDYIHEILLTFFTALTFVGAWRWIQSRHWAWACVSGVALGLMSATKETFVLPLAAMALSGLSVFAWTRCREKQTIRFSTVPSGQIALALGLALLVAILFFTSFFTNAAGPIDAIRTYLPWLQRARGASTHIHPWDFYFERLFWFHPKPGWFWSEGLIGALALVGFVAALTRHGIEPSVALVRLIALYTFWLTLMYTFLPYKTPWCALGFYHGMILLAGVGAAALWRLCRNLPLKILLVTALAVGTGQLYVQSLRANFGQINGNPVAADPVNPYVYAQTSPDVLGLIDTVNDLETVSPEKNAAVEVMSPDSYWPLPWYFRRLPNIGYWDNIPAHTPAPIRILAPRLTPPFEQDGADTMAGDYQLRPNVFLQLYARSNLWSQYLHTRLSRSP